LVLDVAIGGVDAVLVMVLLLIMAVRGQEVVVVVSAGVANPAFVTFRMSYGGLVRVICGILWVWAVRTTLFLVVVGVRTMSDRVFIVIPGVMMGRGMGPCGVFLAE
jgi:hypothetical protein